MLSCGYNFTVCVDCEGFMWCFGQNCLGQLGTGNKTNFNVPQRIEDIPPVLSVSCGYEHTLITTLMIICGHVEIILTDNYVLEIKKVK